MAVVSMVAVVVVIVPPKKDVSRAKAAVATPPTLMAIGAAIWR